MAFEWWMFTAGANVVMVGVYAIISYTIFSGIARGQQWTSNPLALATGIIFVSCTVGHGLHLAHVFTPLIGVDTVIGAAHRATFGDWRLIAWDGMTAAVAIWYLTLRGRLAVVYGGAALCEDMQERQRQAGLLHHSVVRGLRQARDQLETGANEDAGVTLRATLDSSKGIITQLLGEKGSVSSMGPGDLRRERGSG